MQLRKLVLLRKTYNFIQVLEILKLQHLFIISINWLTFFQHFMNWLQHEFRAAGHDISTPKMADVRFPLTALTLHLSQRKKNNKVQIMAEYSSSTVPLRDSRDPAAAGLTPCYNDLICMQCLPQICVITSLISQQV